MGTSGDYAPFSQDGRGFDVDVADALARDLGFEIEWVRFRWPELEQRLGAGDFDLAMSGITWRPERAVTGYMTRAVAAGGPCLISSSAEPKRIAVNRGGVLERWARARYPDREIVTTDDNRSLPERLRAGEVEAIVTDSFELAHFRRPGMSEHCEPAAWRKVYWVGPARAEQLGPRIDAWLASHESELRTLRARWFGSEAARGEGDHLVDLVARRLAFMPQVASWKRARGIAIEDAERERTVLNRASQAARARGLDPAKTHRFFALQIELAKRVQRRAPASAPSLDLETQLRPVLLRLGDRVVAALAAGARFAAADPAPLAAWLSGEEIERLRESLSP